MKMQEIESGNWVFVEDFIPEEIHGDFELAMQALDIGRIDLAERRLKEVIKLCPTHIDALHHLAILYRQLDRDIEAFAFVQAAVGVGLNAMPDKFSWEKSRLEWGFLENRPFMRAYHALGLWFLDHHHFEDAIAIFSRLLSICPDDNLGIRYLLPQCWFSTSTPEKVIEHCSKYHHDAAPEIQYSLGLAMVQAGKMESAKSVLESAVKNMPLVAKEILKKTHRRPNAYREDTFVWGGADQAYQYWLRNGKYWLATEKATHLLRIVARSG